MKPLIRITPPGPNASAVIKEDSKCISQSMVRELPLVFSHAKEANIWDVDGNRYIDFNSFIAVMNVGHAHPKVVAAAKQQLDKGSHAAFLDFYSDVPVKLAKKLLAFLPGFERVYYSNSGAESIEAAMKLARRHTGRKYFISFYGGFHGRTYGALSLTASKTIQRSGFGPFLSVIHAPYPNPYRCPVGSEKTCGADTIRYMEEEIFSMEVDPHEVAAIFVEPVQGESGYIIPPITFMQRLRKLCDKYAILLVDDEIQSGCFRTGKFLAMEHFRVKPDVVCIAKGIGGGLPLGITASSRKIMSWPAGSHASTFGGNLASCSAALAVLGIFSQKGFGKMVERKGRYIMKYLKEFKEQYEIIGDVRGLGLMLAIELVKNRETKEPAIEERDKLIYECFKKGLLLLPAGQSVIRLAPPLIMGKEDIDASMEILGDVLNGKSYLKK